MIEYPAGDRQASSNLSVREGHLRTCSERLWASYRFSRVKTRALESRSPSCTKAALLPLLRRDVQSDA